MNQYTLKFKDNKLECLYTTLRVQSTSYPIFIIMSALIGIYMSMVIIEKCISQEYRLVLLLCSGTLCYLMISLFIVRRRIEWADYSLCILNQLFVLFQLEFDADESIYTAFLFGSNLMIAQCVILFVVDFNLAFLSVITMTLTKLCVIEQHLTLGYRSYILTMMGLVMLIMCLYTKNSKCRHQYLLALKDRQWEQLLPQIIQQKYLMLKFNQEQLRFENIQSQTSLDSQNTVQFIRESKLEDQTLEQFLYERYKLLYSTCGPTTQNCYDLKVHNNKEIIQIKYYEFFLTELTFVIVQESQDTQEFRRHYEQINKQQFINFSVFISKLSMILQKKIKTLHFKYTYEALLAMQEFQVRFLLAQGKINCLPVRPHQLFRKYIALFPHIRSQLCCDNNVVLLTIKPLLTLWFICLLRNIKGRDLEISVITNLNIEIVLIGQFNRSLQQDPKFIQAVQLLMIDWEETNNGYRFRFLSIVEQRFTQQAQTLLFN